MHNYEEKKHDSNFPFFSIAEGHGAIVTTSIHSGHAARDEVERLFALDGADRLREEDPYTDTWTKIADTRIIVNRSRFEVDLNRPREKAVYILPEDAWGLHIWKKPLDEGLISRSLEQYDNFYSTIKSFLIRLLQEHEKLVIYDIHSYNHRRNGFNAPPASPEGNPEINVGTGTMDRERWAPLVDGFIHDLRQYNYLGRHLDVRENVKFRGGNFPKWVHANFSGSVCALAIEVKKFYMDEWSGNPDQTHVTSVTNALNSTVPGAIESLRKIL